MTYLERYRAGEYEQVWADLVALGPKAYSGPAHEDALAVARETMRRVRANLETLVPRLVAAGYQFGYGWAQPPADEPFDWRLRAEHRGRKQEIGWQPPILTIHSDIEDQTADRRARLERLRALDAPAIIIANEERMLAELNAQPRVAALLQELEEHTGALPLSLHAWYEVVGGVNFAGYHPDWTRLVISVEDQITTSYRENSGHPMSLLEPVQIWPFSSMEGSSDAPLASHQRWNGAYRSCVMPNEHTAYLEVGQDNFDYEIKTPCECADAPLIYERHETTFVKYLRISLRWAGFPGWDRLPIRPESDLATLTAGLEPF